MVLGVFTANAEQMAFTDSTGVWKYIANSTRIECIIKDYTQNKQQVTAVTVPSTLGVTAIQRHIAGLEQLPSDRRRHSQYLRRYTPAKNTSQESMVLL